ncbi:MAG: phosphoribosylformylglycinamidine cyclo-ligase [Candidatus Eisenbacteria bacterium]
MPTRESSEYSRAGVDIDAGREAVDLMKDAVRSTWGPAVLAEYGGFAGLFDIADCSHDVLAMTIDGVGTKLKVASMCGRYDSIGMDIVNHCTDDLLVQRARPLLFADYFASSSLEPRMVAEAVGGMAEACRALRCSLIAGETAEMPGVYCEGEFDIVGCMLGTVSRTTLDGIQPVVPGDVLIGLPSTGLHTNGYSLARHVIFEKAGMDVDTEVPELGCTIGEALLAVHREYLTVLEPHLADARIHAMAHITGGGFFDNIERVLPKGCQARIDKSSWEPPPIFRLLCDIGKLDDSEAYRVFNMGIGLVVVVERGSEVEFLSSLSRDGLRATVVGEVAADSRGVFLT